MEQGWVYVLVNSSIPGLAKVGCTTRPPADRAAELSAATGVATPFVIAFEQSFAACAEAERQIHAELDRRGLRVAPNREFFRGPASEIIRVILDVAQSSEPPPAAAADLSADRLLREGDAALNGEGETLQDLAEAMRCYRAAVARGSLIAYERMGQVLAVIYAMRRDRASRRRMLALLKEGARRGNYYCYVELSALFGLEGHTANYLKAWDLFFARRADSFRADLEADGQRFIEACARYIGIALDLGVPPGHTPELRGSAEPLIAHLLVMLDRARGEPIARKRATFVLRWAYENLAAAPPTPKPNREPRAWKYNFFARAEPAAPA